MYWCACKKVKIALICFISQPQRKVASYCRFSKQKITRLSMATTQHYICLCIYTYVCVAFSLHLGSCDFAQLTSYYFNATHYKNN